MRLVQRTFLQRSPGPVARGWGDLFGRCTSWGGRAWGAWTVCIYKKWTCGFCRLKTCTLWYRWLLRDLVFPDLGVLTLQLLETPGPTLCTVGFISFWEVRAYAWLVIVCSTWHGRSPAAAADWMVWRTALSHMCSLRTAPEKVAVAEPAKPSNRESRKTFKTFGLVIDKL